MKMLFPKVIVAATEVLTEAGRPLTVKELQRRTRARLRKELPKEVVSTKLAFTRFFRECRGCRAWRVAIVEIDAKRRLGLPAWPKNHRIDTKSVDTTWFTDPTSAVEAAARLLEVVRSLDPKEVETLVGHVIERTGSEALTVEKTTDGADGGVDIVARRPDPVQSSQQEVQCIQVKRYTNKTGRPEIDKFRGALRTWKRRYPDASKFTGLFVTTGEFSRGVREHVKNDNAAGDVIALWDGRQLANRMLHAGIGVQFVIDADFFKAFGCVASDDAEEFDDDLPF